MLCFGRAKTVVRPWLLRRALAAEGDPMYSMVVSGGVGVFCGLRVAGLWLTVGELSALFLRAKTGEDAAGLWLFRGRAVRWFGYWATRWPEGGAATWFAWLRQGGAAVSRWRAVVVCVEEK